MRHIERALNHVLIEWRRSVHQIRVSYLRLGGPVGFAEEDPHHSGIRRSEARLG